MYTSPPFICSSFIVKFHHSLYSLPPLLIFHLFLQSLWSGFSLPYSRETTFIKPTNDSGCQLSSAFLLSLSKALIYLVLFLTEALSSLGSLDAILTFQPFTKHFFTIILIRAILPYLIYQIASYPVFLVPLSSPTDYSLHRRWNDSQSDALKKS